MIFKSSDLTLNLNTFQIISHQKSVNPKLKPAAQTIQSRQINSDSTIEVNMGDRYVKVFIKD